MSDEFKEVDNKLLGSKDLRRVVIELTSIHYDWFKLGEHLDIPVGTLRSIAGQHNNDHFRQTSDMISAWISRPTKEHHPSWRVLCQALADMGKRELAYEIAGIEDDQSSASKSASSATGPVSHVAPTVEDLKEQLHDLTDWELFATHLPGIGQSDITKISTCSNYHGIDQQKLELYRVWIKNCADASWDHVIMALEKNRQNRLVSKIKEWLKTKGRKVHTISKSAILPSQTVSVKSTVNGHTLEDSTGTESTDNGHNGLEAEDNNWDLSPESTVTCPISLIDLDYIPTGTVNFKKQKSHAKGGGQKRHLVVAITNEYKGCADKDQLFGIKKDREQLHETFGDEEMFHLIELENTSKEVMEGTLRKIMERLQRSFEQKYKSAFIIFSGHGCMIDGKSYIISEDCKPMSLDGLIGNFEKKFGSTVPKFFLIDSCREKLKGTRLSKGVPVNSLYAYSTKEGCPAYMDDDDENGSDWLQEVTKGFSEENAGTVVEVIEKANKKVSQMGFQDPQLINKLRNEDKNLRINYKAKESYSKTSGSRQDDLYSRHDKVRTKSVKTSKETSPTKSASICKIIGSVGIFISIMVIAYISYMGELNTGSAVAIFMSIVVIVLISYMGLNGKH